MISQQLAERVLSAALEQGADFAELFLEDSETNRIATTDGAVETAVSSRICGAGVRVLLGARSAYAYTSDFDEKRLLQTARAAAAALRGGGPAAMTALRPHERTETRQAVPFANVGNDARVELLLEAYRAARAVSPEVSQICTGYLDRVRRIWIYNSEGLSVSDERPYTRSNVQCVAMANGEAQTGFEGPGCCRGFEAYRTQLDLPEAGRRAASTAVTMLHAAECPAGYVPVVIDGGFGGVIFHEACGHSLEATFVGRGTSEFCGKLGQKVASDCVTAVDDGTLEHEWGTITIDDEGYPGKRNVLIENGVLKGYLIDRLGGRRMGMAPTGSSRRQDYRLAPTSRMTNTFIAPGSDDEDEMIRGVDRGLFAKKMGGGSVNPVTGEFNFAVDEGYWIKNGEILCPVRGATLVGRGTEVLLKIDRVGGRMWMGAGMCGSLSGSVPVNVGQPRIRVTGITVGGKGGAL